MLKVVLGAALALASCAAASPDLGQGIDYSAVVRVDCFSALGISHGTAFRIAPNTYVTAAHVVSNASPRICAIDETRTEILQIDNDADIATIRGPIGASVIRLNCRGFIPGRIYRSIGYMGGEYLTTVPITATKWTSNAENGHRLRVFLEPSIIPGVSGGPVVDDRGRGTGINNRHSPARARDLRDTFVCRH